MKYKVQAYDLNKNTKESIEKLCKEQNRSESFIVSKLLNKLLDPVSGKPDLNKVADMIRG